MLLHVAHILVENRYEADDVVRKLGEGESFSSLAQKFSKCPSAAAGGDLGPVESGRLDESFAEAAAILKPGEVSPIVRTRFGYHLIKKLD